MKKNLLLIFAVFSAIGAYAQSGFGTPLPHESAELEVFSLNKGVLIPRVELSAINDTDTITGGEYPESLLVYHTGVADLEAGYYFWREGKWHALVSNSTLYTYIKETAKDGNVTINVKEDKSFEVVWVDQATGEKKEISLNDFINGNNVFTENGESIVGKFGDQNIMRYTTKLTLSTAFTSVTLPKKIEGMIVNATLINETTSAIVRGVIGKSVVGEETTLGVGTVGTIITSNPAGTYYVIVEYLKPIE